MVGDFLSNAPETLAGMAPAADLVLLDVASDRRGAVAVGGSVVSRTAEVVNSGVLRQFPGYRTIAFGTSEHFELFRTAARDLYRTLAEVGASERALVLKFPFTQVSSDGSIVPDEVGRSSSAWNEEFERYYAEIASAGFRMIELPASLAVTTPEHAWGPGQDHFIDEAYKWWADQIESFLRGD